MRTFDRILTEAVGKYVDQNCSEEEEHDYSGQVRERMTELLQTEKGGQNMKKGENRKLRIALLAAAAVIALTAAVTAAAPALREFWNMHFLQDDSEGTLTEVPDGWIGVYTAEDLDAIRDNMRGKYILMNDIVLTDADYDDGGIFEGGFEPIGNEVQAFFGTFNGNGHVISGLRVETDARVRGSGLCGGLFGVCKRIYDFDQIPVYAENGDPSAEWMDVNGDGEITEDEQNLVMYETKNKTVSGGLIKNLGLTDSSITVICNENGIVDFDGDGEPERPSRGMVGAIAGWADYIVGCYTENVTVSFVGTESLDLTGSGGCLCVGGVVGGCEYMDCCWSNASVSAEVILDSPESEAHVYLAGLAGQSYSCVTSYFDGTVESAFPDGGVTTLREETVPIVMTADVHEVLMRQIDRANGVDYDACENLSEHSWDMQKFDAFYLLSDYVAYDFEVQDFVTAETEDEAVYLLDPQTRPRELSELSSLIASAFPDGDFAEFCRENSMKCGSYNCYDLRGEPDAAFEGFDFDGIWTWNEAGRPVLSLFAD